MEEFQNEQWLKYFEVNFLREDTEPYRGKKNIIADKSFSFALEIISFHQELKGVQEYEIGKQLLRCGTSIGANVSEATAAQTKKDFIAKMAIASKEARETQYWLRLISESKTISFEPTDLLNKCNELVRILTSIVKTAQSNIQ